MRAKSGAVSRPARLPYRDARKAVQHLVPLDLPMANLRTGNRLFFHIQPWFDMHSFLGEMRTWRILVWFSKGSPIIPFQHEKTQVKPVLVLEPLQTEMQKFLDLAFCNSGSVSACRTPASQSNLRRKASTSTSGLRYVTLGGIGNTCRCISL